MTAASGERRRLVLWTIPAAYFLFVAGEFAAMTHITLLLTERGESAFRVGLFVSALWLGILAASLRAHDAVQRHGHARVFVASTALAVLAIASMLQHPHYAGWLAAAAVLGFGGGFVWVAGESWLAEAAPRESRGLMVGLFETSVGLGLMAGPALVPVALWMGWLPTALGLAVVAAGLLCSVALLWAPSPVLHPDGSPTVSTGGPAGRTQAPVTWREMALPLVSLAAVSGLMESGISSLLPSISMRLGFDLATAAILGAVIGAGSALLQGPFGWLADRIGIGRGMGIAWVLVVSALAALVAGAHDPGRLLWVIGFVLGGVGGAVYTLVVIELGHRLSGSSLVKAMSALVTAYTLGTAGGPMIGGWLFDQTGLRGLALALLAVALVGCALAWRALRPAALQRHANLT
jgi:MFS family permease